MKFQHICSRNTYIYVYCDSTLWQRTCNVLNALRLTTSLDKKEVDPLEHSKSINKFLLRDVADASLLFYGDLKSKIVFFFSSLEEFSVEHGWALYRTLTLDISLILSSLSRWRYSSCFCIRRITWVNVIWLRKAPPIYHTQCEREIHLYFSLCTAPKTQRDGCLRVVVYFSRTVVGHQ